MDALTTVDPTQNLSASTTPVNTTIKYAPVQKTVKGNYNLQCVSLKWLDNEGTPLGSVSSSCRATANVYKDLSNGNLLFNPISRSVKVNFNHAGKNLKNAEAAAKKVVIANTKNTNPNLFVLVNNRAQGFSHGSADTAHLYGALARDFYHEVGHCRPTVLGHSGKYDAKGKLLPYDDGTSFMGRFSSSKLTAPQLYLLGWLPEKKVAQHDLTSPTTDYNVEQLYGAGTDAGLKAVYIPRADKRPLYLSMPRVNDKFTFALHLASGRGTQRVQVFGNQAQYEGLSFEKVAETADYSTVRISAVSAGSSASK